MESQASRISPKKIVAVVTKMQAASEADIEEVKVALVRLMHAAIHAPGIWSGEIIPTVESMNREWLLILRFDTSEDANFWRQSRQCASLLAEITENSRMIISPSTDAPSTLGTVTTSIVEEVKEGMEKDFFDWQYRIQIVQAKHPGFRGVYFQPPTPDFPNKWSNLIRFDSPESMENWLDSKERREFLLEKDRLVQSTDLRALHSSYPGWFPVDKNTGKPFPKWKTAMLLLSALFPCVILELRFLSPLMAGLNPGLCLFINLIGSIFWTTWIALPMLIRVFAWWISPEKGAAGYAGLKGIICLLLIYAGELLLFWQLLVKK